MQLTNIASHLAAATVAPTPRGDAPPTGWWNQTGAAGAAQQAAATGVNWPNLFGFAAAILVFLMLVLAIRQAAGSGKGNIKKAGEQSAVMGISVGWLTVAIVLGAMTLAVVVGSAVRSVFG